jgi:protein-S-isoprenylcysteine O-methyltransferase Ste14
MRELILIHAGQASMSMRLSVFPVLILTVDRLSMAKSATKSTPPKTHRVTLDPFNGILGVFFLVLALVFPVAMPASDGRLNVLHYLGITVSCLVSAFFFWRWLRAQLAYALRDEAEEEVARVRATTFAQDAQASQESAKT